MIQAYKVKMRKYALKRIERIMYIFFEIMKYSIYILLG